MFPPVIYLGPNYGGSNEDNGEFLQKVPCMYCYTQCPHQPTPLLETPGHSQASLGQSLVESRLLSPGSWCAQGSVCALQESVWLYTWTSPYGQSRNQIDYILFSQRWRSSRQSAKTKLGADSGSGHELLIAKFRLKWKKVGKNTRPFRYDLNQIPYYAVEVRNRFKGLDLIDRVPEELWTEFHDVVHEAVIKNIPKRNNPKREMVV